LPSRSRSSGFSKRSQRGGAAIKSSSSSSSKTERSNGVREYGSIEQRGNLHHSTTLIRRRGRGRGRGRGRQNLRGSERFVWIAVQKAFLRASGEVWRPAHGATHPSKEGC
jgi:hypothetical protein